MVVQCGVDLWMLPRYREEVIAEGEFFVTKRNDRGVVERTPKSPDEMTMPEHVEYPVKTLVDWEVLKKRFDPANPKRFPSNWQERCERWRHDRQVLVFQGPRSLPACSALCVSCLVRNEHYTPFMTNRLSKKFYARA